MRPPGSEFSTAPLQRGGLDRVDKVLTGRLCIIPGLFQPEIPFRLHVGVIDQHEGGPVRQTLLLQFDQGQ